MHGPAVVAHEAQGEERARLWQLGLQRVPAQLGNQWTDNPHRRIPVMVLPPVPGPPRRDASSSGSGDSSTWPAVEEPASAGAA